MPSPQTAAHILADFCTSLRWTTLPYEVQKRTRELVLDLLGVAVAGSRQESTAPARALASRYPGSATVIASAIAAAAPWAALANGTAGHAIELDDVTNESSLHPGTVVIPAAAAVAEEQDARMADLFAAVVTGYEVTMRIGNALNAASAYQRGFHPTGIAGIFGATAAAGLLVDLDATQLTRAFGIAGTMASGSLEYLADGSWTKRLNAGWAAHAGVVAATLAAEDFIGPATVFDGSLGVFTSYTDNPRPDLLLQRLGETYQITQVSIKPYACCRYNHGIIDGVLTLKTAHEIQPSDVRSIRLGVLSAGAVLVATPIQQKRTPKNVVDAQFSAPFAAAVALVRGNAGVAEYTQKNVDNTTIRALMMKTECYQDESLDAVYPNQWPAAVEIQTTDDRILSYRVDHPSGDPQNPVPRETLVRKFVDLVDHTGTTDTAESLAHDILQVRGTTRVRDLMQQFGSLE